MKGGKKDDNNWGYASKQSYRSPLSRQRKGVPRQPQSAQKEHQANQQKCLRNVSMGFKFGM
jgi:hypothetical protein